MRKLMLLAAAALSLGVVVPNAVQAQGRVTRQDVMKRKGDDQNVRRVEDRRDDRYACYDRNGKYDPNGNYDRSGNYSRTCAAADRNTNNDRNYACYDRNGRYDPNGGYDRNGNYDRNCTDDRNYDRNGNYDRNANNDRNGKGGPAFCRSGAGHPVFGRQWCYDKGYGLGSNNNDRNVRWDRVTWDDVIFRRRPNYTSNLGRNVLMDLLGGSVFNRLDAQRRYFGINAPLVGQWNSYEGNSVLLLNAGGTPIAELVDRNGDRRVDYILLNHR